MTPLSTDERRALALLAALLLLASAARWLERPRSILDDVPEVDLATLEEASREAKSERAAASRPRRRSPRSGATTSTPEPNRASEYTRATPIDPGPARAAGADSSTIDLNTATAEQLQRIPGIGPAIAARLLARRDSLGRFRSYDDVDVVRGVGPVLLARIRAASVVR